jgi:hypothetical protein
VIRGYAYDFGIEDREEAFDDQLLPEAWGGPPRRPRLPAFAALHGAYHVLNRRMAMELGTIA